MAGTTWHTFTPGTVAKSSEVNENFDWLEGSLVPMVAGSMTTAIYDLGTTTAAWRNIYLSGNIVLGGDTITSFDGASIEATNGVVTVKTGGISTAMLAANAVTQVFSTAIPSPDLTFIGADTTVKTLSITASGNPYLLLGGLQTVRAYNDAGGTLLYSVYAVLDASVTVNGAFVDIERLGGGASALSIGQALFSTIITPAAGGHTYTLRYFINNGSFVTIPSYLIAVELKK